MIKNKEIKQDTLKKLNSKWGKAIGIYMAFALIDAILTTIETCFSKTGFSSLINLSCICIVIPLKFGFLINIIKFYRNDENVGAFDFFKNGFKNFGNAWGIWWFTFLKLLLPSILMVVPYIGIIILALLIKCIPLLSVSSLFYIICVVFLVLFVVTAFIFIIWYICKSLLYTFANYIMIENPDIKPSEAVQRSESLMKGHRVEYFKFILSFFGWFLLGILSLGIGFIWIGPYFTLAKIEFYNKLLLPDNVKTIE